MSVSIAVTRPDSDEARMLIAELDAILEPLYPRESRHGLSVDRLIDAAVAFFLLHVDDTAVGCAGILLIGRDYGEIKRMYVRPPFRGRGLAALLLRHLEDHARANDVHLLRLETGIHQREAIALYERMGYRKIPPFGPYFEDPLSLCFEKRID
jgi:putative acetyltransferase